MARTADTAEIDGFRASDLIGPAGIGSNGERLVNSLLDAYPPALQAALVKRINPVLDAKLDDRAHASVAKIAGVLRVEAVHVRGGERREADATVTYAFLDAKGAVWKGCFPYSDLGSSSSDNHVSQRDSLANSAVAQEFVAENPHRESAPPEPVDEYAALDSLASADAAELVQMMREHPERVDSIKAFEKALRGAKTRKTVMDFEPEPPAEESDGGSGETS